MTPEAEVQFILALIEAGVIDVAKKHHIEPHFFRNMQAQAAYAVILDYASQPGTLGMVPGMAYIHARNVPLVGVRDPQFGDVESMAVALKNEQVRSLLTTSCQMVLNLAGNSPREAAQKMRDAINDAKLTKLLVEGEDESLDGGFADLLGVYATRQNTGGVVGLRTGLEGLDYLTKGLQGRKTYVVYAPPKNMKTFFVLYLAAQVLKQGRSVLIFTTEMPAAEMNERLAAMLAGISLTRMSDGALLPDELSRLQQLGPSLTASTAKVRYWQVNSYGPAAIAEVRAKMQEQPDDLGLVIWDGHYRSATAGSAKWEDIYPLMQMTRAISLDPKMPAVPLIVVTQEGSSSGDASYKVYEREADFMLRLELQGGQGSSTLQAAVKAARSGPRGKIDISIEFERTSFTQVGFWQEGR